VLSKDVALVVSLPVIIIMFGLIMQISLGGSKELSLEEISCDIKISHLESPHSDELSLSEESASYEPLMQYSDDESIHDEPLLTNHQLLKLFLLLLMSTLETCIIF